MPPFTPFTAGPTAPAPRPGVLHRPMLAADIIGFGRRAPQVHDHLRTALRTVIGGAFTAAGLPDLHGCHTEDRGDGLLAIAPADVSAELLLGPLPHHLLAALRHHNRYAAPAARLRLRIAVTAGYVHTGPTGAAGRQVVHLFRLLDAPAFKDLLTTQHADLGLITSDYLHTEIITTGPGLIDPAAFAPVTIASKETRARAWTWLPALIPPPDHRSHHATGDTAHGPANTATTTGEDNSAARSVRQAPGGWWN